MRAPIVRSSSPTHELIADGDSLMIDAGATTIYVARRLAAERNQLSAITTSFGVASALAANPSHRVRICPGDYDAGDGGVIGADTVNYLSQFNVAHAVIGASRLDADGPSDFNPDSVWIKRAMIRHARQVVLVLDHQKLASSGYERICPLEEVDCLVTDSPPPEGLKRALNAAKVAVHLP